MGLFRAVSGPIFAQFKAFSGLFWVVSRPFWAISGHLRAVLGHFRAVWGQFLGHFVPFEGNFGPKLTPPIELSSSFWAVFG